MARLKHFTRDVKLPVRMDPTSTEVTVFGAKAGKVFEVPDGYYANYCIKTLGCVLVTPESEVPSVKVAPPAPAPEPAPEAVAAPVAEEVAAPAAEPAAEEVPAEEAPEAPAAVEAVAEAAPEVAPAPAAEPAKKYGKKSK